LAGNSSNFEHGGPQRGTVEEDGWQQSCAQIRPNVKEMDAILYGVEWVLIRNPGLGEPVGTLPDGSVLRAFASTPHAFAPSPIVVYYWDDGQRLHWYRVR
jgi:hypothetical protein